MYMVHMGRFVADVVVITVAGCTDLAEGAFSFVSTLLCELSSVHTRTALPSLNLSCQVAPGHGACELTCADERLKYRTVVMHLVSKSGENQAACWERTCSYRGAGAGVHARNGVRDTTVLLHAAPVIHKLHLPFEHGSRPYSTRRGTDRMAGVAKNDSAHATEYHVFVY
jgi:hypothetical protein